MPADVNVTEKVARALYVRTARDNATHDEAVVPWEELHPYQQDRWLSYAADALGWLADPEVQAGIAGVLYRLDNPGLPWERAREDYLGLAEVYMRRAAAVVEWLRGRAL